MLRFLHAECDCHPCKSDPVENRHGIAPEPGSIKTIRKEQEHTDKDKDDGDDVGLVHRFMQKIPGKHGYINW